MYKNLIRLTILRNTPHKCHWNQGVVPWANGIALSPTLWLLFGPIKVGHPLQSSVPVFQLPPPLKSVQKVKSRNYLTVHLIKLHHIHNTNIFTAWSADILFLEINSKVVECLGFSFFHSRATCRVVQTVHWATATTKSNKHSVWHEKTVSSPQ